MDLSSLTKDQTSTLCIGRRSLNYLTTRKVPIKEFLKMKKIANINAYFSKNNNNKKQGFPDIILPFLLSPLDYFRNL